MSKLAKLKNYVADHQLLIGWTAGCIATGAAIVLVSKFDPTQELLKLPALTAKHLIETGEAVAYATKFGDFALVSLEAAERLAQQA